MSLDKPSMYTPLFSPTCIRVINIEPAEQKTDALICSTEELDIIHGTGYRAFSALSYRWGDLTTPHLITLNNHPLSIGQNLFDFLLYARDAGWTKHLWIDALCINQADIRERNEQVARMGEIYSLASSVLVWLGILDGDERYALEDIRDALERTSSEHSPDAEERQATTETQFWERQSRMRQQAEAAAKPLDPHGPMRSFLEKYPQNVRYQEYLTAKGQRGLVRVMQNPYWMRKWILQELLLSGPNATLITGGDRNVRITTIAPIVSKFIEQARKYIAPKALQDVRDVEMMNLRRFLGCRDNGSVQFKSGLLQFWKALVAADGECTYRPQPLMAIVDDYHEQLCADRRDNVYALLGLSTLPQGKIQVDYGAGVPEVYLAMKAAVADDMARHGPECIAAALKLTDEEKRLVRQRELEAARSESERRVSWGSAGSYGSDAGSFHGNFATRDSNSEDGWELSDPESPGS
jgi:hypothetical protein